MGLIGTSLITAGGFDPDISPSGTTSENAPWLDYLQTLGGHIVATILVCLVIVMVVAALLWVAGKLGAGGAAQQGGLSALLWALVAAAVIGSASGAILWFSGADLFGVAGD